MSEMRRATFVRNTNIKHRLSNIEYGDIAQLGERLNGIQEASGSIPLISTNDIKKQGFANWQSLVFYALQRQGDSSI